MRGAKPEVTEPSGSPENLERFSLLGYDAHEIEDMHHDYSIFAYEMNGKPLPKLDGGSTPPAE